MDNVDKNKENRDNVRTGIGRILLNDPNYIYSSDGEDSSYNSIVVGDIHVTSNTESLEEVKKIILELISLKITKNGGSYLG
jgi:hypothetical protein